MNAIYRLLGMGALPLGTIFGGILVTATGPLGHTLSLRMPFLVTAGINAGLFLVGFRLLTPLRWNSALERAGDAPGAPNGLKG